MELFVLFGSDHTPFEPEAVLGAEDLAQIGISSAEMRIFGRERVEASRLQVEEEDRIVNALTQVF